MSSLNDPRAVRDEYANERGLLGRRAAYRYATGPNAPEIAFEAIAEAGPWRVLEVGCGPGELAARVQDELAAEVVAVDMSERMVELARGRGVDARVGDVQELPFGDAAFDLAIAAWMLYHVPDVDRGLSELARVLRPGGRLVAVTNGRQHLRELHDLLGGEFPTRAFDDETAPELLARHFVSVECRDASGWIDFPDRGEVASYIDASRSLWSRELPGDFDGPLRVRRAPLVYVAEKQA